MFYALALALALLQTIGVASSAPANHLPVYAAATQTISTDGGTSGWGGDIAAAEGGTSGWGGDIAAAEGGTSGWGGDIA